MVRGSFGCFGSNKKMIFLIPEDWPLSGSDYGGKGLAQASSAIQESVLIFSLAYLIAGPQLHELVRLDLGSGERAPPE
jgi:hypothetical protein